MSERKQMARYFAIREGRPLEDAEAYLGKLWGKHPAVVREAATKLYASLEHKPWRPNPDELIDELVCPVCKFSCVRTRTGKARIFPCGDKACIACLNVGPHKWIEQGPDYWARFTYCVDSHDPDAVWAAHFNDPPSRPLIKTKGEGEEHVCPKCHVTRAVSDARKLELFGRRGKYWQSYCKFCKSTGHGLDFVKGTYTPRSWHAPQAHAPKVKEDK